MSTRTSVVGLALCGLVAAGGTARSDEVYGDPGVPVAGNVLGTVVRTNDAEELRYVILRRLTDRYADEQGISVTQAEQDAYIEHMTRIMQQDRRKREARRDEIARSLASASLSDTERAALTAERDALNELLANLSEPAGAAEDRAARAEVASAFIRQWKIDSALYHQYGGRIIFQQGGPEPLDAYRRFLEEQQARGAFEILNNDLDADFWRYYVTDSIHTFYPPGSEAETQAFTQPWWQSE